MTKTPGQIAYEEDVRFTPTYDHGIPRHSWDQLSEIARWSWERQPEPSIPGEGGITTSNPHAAWLINHARTQCVGCRLSWRLYGNLHKTRLSAPIECSATDPRSILRRIAAAARRRETE